MLNTIVSNRCRVFAAALTLGILTAVAPAAHATGCGSATTVAVDVWDEAGPQIVKAGCTAAAAAAGAASGGGASLPALAACLESAELYEKVAREMIRFWNEQSDNSWNRIGPRRLEAGFNSGTVVGTFGRLFVAAVPAPGPIEVVLEKTGGKGKVGVAVCTTDAEGNTRKVRDYTFDSGKGNTGDKLKVSLPNALGKVISVHIDGKSATKSFEYKIRAKGL